MFERIAYVSRASDGLGPRDVYDLIRAAHNRNGAAGLTGGLVFLDGWFVQVLEGEPFRLDACFARIVADRRHHSVEVRGRVRAEQRLFPGEWMALRQTRDVPPEVLARFAYVPGLPPRSFPGERVEAFVLACCTTPVPA